MLGTAMTVSSVKDVYGETPFRERLTPMMSPAQVKMGAYRGLSGDELDISAGGLSVS